MNKVSKNAIYSVLNLVINAVFLIIIRRIVIKIYGVELLGVEGVIGDIFNTLSLAEMGIQVAIAYRLYKPVVDKNEEREMQIFGIYKRIYAYIGIAIFTVGILIIPVLKYIINTSVALEFIIGIYMIQLGAVVLPYFIGCYRILFLVHEEQAVYLKIDVAAQGIVNILQIIVLICWRNYLFYLLCIYIRVIFSNAFIRKKCRERFEFLQKKCVISNVDIDNLKSDLKQIVFGNLAGYVYNSTDNLLISFFCGAFYVGMLSNYKTIGAMIKMIVGVVNNSITPSVGNYLCVDRSKDEVQEVYGMLVLGEYILCSLLLVPVYCLADILVEIWLGKEYVVSSAWLILIIVDIFINTIHEPNAVFMRSLGMFKEDKTISIIAMLINIVLSILLVKKYQVVGVLTGTIFALIFFWIRRSCVVNEYLNADYKKYWIRNIIYVFCFLGECFLGKCIVRYVSNTKKIGEFLLLCVLIELMVVLYNLIVLARNKDVRKIVFKIKNRKRLREL